MANKIEKIKEGLREFKLSTLAVDNATSIFLLTFMILLFGVQAYIGMPKEQYPEAVLPTVFINTVYFGNSAKDIENLITRPIEKELQTISGVKDIRSTSMQDYSVITTEFNADMEMEDVLRKVKDAVDKAKQELPADLTKEPDVNEVNFSDLPVMTVNLAGDYSNDDLREYAELLEDKLDEIDEVSDINIKGALDREVKINVNLPRMESLKISFTDIENAVKTENMNMSGGELLKNDFRRSIRVVGEFKSVKEIANMIVKSENNNPIYLKDIADVSFGYKDKTSIARADGLPVVSLDVIKRRGSNLLDASDKIKATVASVTENYFPDNLNVTTFNDQSVATRDGVSNLENSIISGVILVVLILLFFLGIRNAMFVGLAIPLSMLMGFMILNMLGYTINMVVLFGLILALGLLVDNAIVVVENIYRYMQNGYEGADAAKYGAGEVAVPIIASTATTLAAFIPLAFWPGIMGEFMKYLPITLIIVLSSSLFVALVINPVFTSVLMKLDQKADSSREWRKRALNVMIGLVLMAIVATALHYSGVMLWLRNLLGIVGAVTFVNFFFLRPASFYFQDRVLPWLERVYDRFIRGALYRYVPVFVFAGTFALLFFAISLLNANMPKVEFFPVADPLYVNAFVELPMGKDIEATNRMMENLEDKIDEAIKPYRGIVEAVLSQIGENTADPNGPPEPGASPNKARLTVSFVPAADRGGVSSFEVMDKIREAVKGNPGVQVVVDKNADGPPVGKPINLEISGEDIDQLALLSDDVIKFINSKNIAGIEELKADVNMGKPELLVHINREAARRYGVSTYNISNAIRTAVFGKEVSKFKQGEDEFPIMIRLNDQYRNDVGDLLNQKITFRSPSNGRIHQVPIAAVADVKYSSTYSSVKRKDLDRVITVYSNVLGGYNANEIVAELQDLMMDYPWPENYRYEFTGEQQEQAANMEFLTTAFMIALFSIFIIIVAQFNSIISPFIIILSVLFSTIGVLLGYVFTGKDLIIIMTGVGVISLAGVVVNNAIVLIDYINLLVKRKQEAAGVKNELGLEPEQVKEAIIEGGATRLRPVLLTAITTVLGLIPLAIGFNFNFFTLISRLDPQYYVGGDNVAFWGPMAWTVIYGLVFATFLTLVVVPVMYWLAYRLKRLFLKKPSKVEVRQEEIELAK